MKKIYLIVISFPLIFAFQNCGVNTEFSTSLPFPDDIIPYCVEITSENFTPEVTYEYSQYHNFPEWDQVMSSPVVGDINGDKISEIAYISFRVGGGFHYNVGYGVLRVIDGKTKKILFEIGDPALAPLPTVTPLMIDIDKDGKGEIFYQHHSKTKMVAINFDGSTRWVHETGVIENYPYGGYAATDLNSDGFADIVGHGLVVNETIVDGTITLNQKGYKDIESGKVVTRALFVTTLDDNSTSPQIVDNTGVYDYKNNTFTQRYSLNKPSCGYCFPAAADIDKNTPGKEIIVTGSGVFKIYSNQGTILADLDLATQNPEDICHNRTGVGGGQASIGNFDNNEETVEVAIATGKSLTIYDTSGNKLAGSTTTDCSSRITGVTSFDFNGDGKPEILYGDEKKFRVYSDDGTSDLKVIYEIDSSSGTLLEYPVVADVTGDWKPEILIVSNNYGRATGETGLRILANSQKDKHWMPSSGVWNQQSFIKGDVTEQLQVDLNFISTAKKLARSDFKINSSGFDIACKK